MIQGTQPTLEERVQHCLDLVGALANDPAMPEPFWERLLEVRLLLENLHIDLREELG